MIVPTKGRKVYYRPNAEEISASNMHCPIGQPLDATIIAVHSDTHVNLLVVDEVGTMFPRLNVPLIQDGEPEPEASFVQWMPYQNQQAQEKAAEAPAQD